MNQYPNITEDIRRKGEFNNFFGGFLVWRRSDSLIDNNFYFTHGIVWRKTDLMTRLPFSSLIYKIWLKIKTGKFLLAWDWRLKRTIFTFFETWNFIVKNWRNKILWVWYDQLHNIFYWMILKGLMIKGKWNFCFFKWVPSKLWWSEKEVLVNVKKLSPFWYLNTIWRELELLFVFEKERT
jgi:hypothetical protein